MILGCMSTLFFKGGVKKQADWGVPNDGGVQFQLILPTKDRELLRYSPSQPMSQWNTYVIP